MFSNDTRNWIKLVSTDLACFTLSSGRKMMIGGVFVLKAELCIAAGLSPLTTWTTTDAESVKEYFLY